MYTTHEYYDYLLMYRGDHEDDGGDRFRTTTTTT